MANLTFVQVFVPLTLTEGLTQMWSLSVEVTFYLVLPILALLARRLPVRARVPVIGVVAVASLAWGLLPIKTPEGVNFLNWPPAYASWFAAGMLLAEFTVRPVGRVHRRARNRWLMAGIGVVAYLVAASPLAGPEGLTPATLGQFVVRTAMGATLAGVLLAPLVLDRPETPHRILGAPVMVTLGRWSYGLFVWHLAALTMAFPIVGRFVFDGDMPVILILTLVFGFAMAAVSYALVENPCRQALRNWEYRRSQRREGFTISSISVGRLSGQPSPVPSSRSTFGRVSLALRRPNVRFGVGTKAADATSIARLTNANSCTPTECPT